MRGRSRAQSGTSVPLRLCSLPWWPLPVSSLTCRYHLSGEDSQVCVLRLLLVPGRVHRLLEPASHSASPLRDVSDSTCPTLNTWLLPSCSCRLPHHQWAKPKICSHVDFSNYFFQQIGSILPSKYVQYSSTSLAPTLAQATEVSQLETARASWVVSASYGGKRVPSKMCIRSCHGFAQNLVISSEKKNKTFTRTHKIPGVVASTVHPARLSCLESSGHTGPWLFSEHLFFLPGMSPWLAHQYIQIFDFFSSVEPAYIRKAFPQTLWPCFIFLHSFFLQSRIMWFSCLWWSSPHPTEPLWGRETLPAV